MILLNRRLKSFPILTILIACSFFFAGQSLALDDEEQFEDFSELDLNDMLDVTVVSASKIEQSLRDSANAIYVITAEDIRRSGVRSIPEALRLAPGVFVAQISGNKWVVTMGGFTLFEYSNKLLVLIDGVSVYNPISGGVDWDFLPVSLEEIDRIEVIRGTGGVLYGANAVNGVINIITRSGETESASFVNVMAGTQNMRQMHATTRLESEDGALSSRVSVSYEEDAGLGQARGTQQVYDGQELATASIRNTVKLDDSAEVHFDARYKGGIIQRPNVDETWRGDDSKLESDIMRGRLDLFFDNGAQLYVQGYRWMENVRIDRDGYETYSAQLVYDGEAQVMVPFELAGTHQFIFGGGYREVYGKSEDILDFDQDFTVGNAYMHDAWKLTDELALNSGVKWEHVNLVDPTWQWRGALVYNPTPQHGIRLSVSNAYRSPTLTETYHQVFYEIPDELAFLIPGWPPEQDQFLASVVGNEDLEPEQVVSYEAEYRGFWFNRVNFDVSYSYREYTNLITVFIADPGFYVDLPPVIGPLSQNITYVNDGQAISNNVEVSMDAKVTDELRVMLNYAHIDIRLTGDKVFKNYEENTPRNLGRAAVSYTHPKGFMVDVSGSYMDEYTVQPVSLATYDFNSYWRMDARIAQKIELNSGDLEIGVVGQNLTEEWHSEYPDVEIDTQPLPLRSAFYGYVEFRDK